MTRSRYAVTVYVDGPKVGSVFDLLARMPVFSALKQLASEAGYTVTGYEARPLKED